MLKITIIDQGYGFSVFGIDQKNLTTELTRPYEILLLRAGAVVFLFVNNVGLHPDGEITRDGSTFHSSPLVNLFRIFRWNLDVDTGPTNGLISGQFDIGLFQCLHRNIHRQHARYVIIIKDKRHLSPYLHSLLLGLEPLSSFLNLQYSISDF